jgi:AcrR family transcriptional regulator
MLTLSPKQREMQERDAHILRVARDLVLVHGYYGMTMDQIARESGCPKGTLYHRFVCKEDILVALAIESTERRNDLLSRGAGFEGKTRERLLALGEATALFGRLHPEDLRILHMATGPIREKASLARVSRLLELERAAMGTLVHVLRDAAQAGDLESDDEDALQEVAIGAWSLVEGGFDLIQSGIPQHTLGTPNPFQMLWRYFNRSIDAYGWRPLFSEWDYEASLANIRQSVFSEEAQALYGEGRWEGDQA